MAGLIRAARVQLDDGGATWTVVGTDHLPIPEADEWLDSLRAQRRSSNTIEAYARHLSLLLRWLASRGSSWETLTFQELNLFVGDLNDGKIELGGRSVQRSRAPDTARAVITAITGFLEYWRFEGRGPTELRLFKDSAFSSRRTDHFLAHVESKRTRVVHRIRVKGSGAEKPVHLINFEEDYVALIDASNTWRDRLLISMLYDGGLRIGQALGLRHDDLDLIDKSVMVHRREDNANGALSKQRKSFEVPLPKRTFTMYSKYLLEEVVPAGIESDYLFTNFRPPVGAPMRAGSAREVLEAVGARAGVEFSPHWLRHTHATTLAKDGWTNAQIAARLGQDAAASADRYVHLAKNDVETKYRDMLTKQSKEER